MKKVWILLFFFTFWLPSLRAQTIRGVVCDSRTNEPVYNATVYLEGTAIHASTNEAGHFELTSKRLIQTKLVVTHIAYDKKLIDNPFQSMPDTVFIKEATNLLDEVVISKKKERFDREQLLQAFREQFLGTSRAAKSCRIENEEDIVILYDLYKRTLEAYCSQPIRIQNPYLGYTVLYELSQFQVVYEGNSISSKAAKDFALEGTPLFIDTANDHKPTLKNRRNTYNGSKNHLFKSIREDQLAKNKFALFQKNLLYSVNDLFSIEPAEEAGKWKLTLIKWSPPKQILHFSMPYTVHLELSVSHRSGESRMDFLVKELLVDYYGNLYPSKGIIFAGAMANRRVGDMLPLDYEVE